MVNAELTAASLQAQLQEDSNYLEESEDFECVEGDDWTQDHKYQVRSLVYKHKESERFFMVHESRSGSPFSDWYYDDPQVVEVYPESRTVVVTDWLQVKS
jgi:hypothetical protein